MEKITSKEVSLVLSGGGARGAFHLGILQGLEDANIEVKSISGTSIGSIVGAGYFAGYSPKELLEFFTSNEFRVMMKFKPFNGGIFELDLSSPFADKLLNGYKNFETLPKPLHVNIVNIDKGECEYKSSGDIKTTLAAACALPPMLNAIKIGENFYADGGIMDNFPIQPLLDSPYPIIGVNLHPNAPLKKRGMLRNLGRAMFLCWYSGVNENTKKCDFYIAPEELTNFSILKTSKAKELFDLGVKSVKEILPL